MDYLSALFIFVFGSIIGSFLNVLILRYGNLFRSSQRSICFSCGHPLNFLDLIPLVSFFALGGKCRYCKSSLSIQYPLVEFLTAITFLFIYLKIGFFNVNLFFYLFVWSIFIAILVYDLNHKIIPDALVYTLIILTALKVLYLSYPDFGQYFWLILAGPMVASPFAFFWLVSKGRWMGFGDAKLALAIGWMLGLMDGISVIILSSLIGSVVGLSLILISQTDFFSWSERFKNLTIKSEMPFAPFLIIGTAIVFFLEVNIRVFL